MQQEHRLWQDPQDGSYSTLLTGEQQKEFRPDQKGDKNWRWAVLENQVTQLPMFFSMLRAGATRAREHLGWTTRCSARWWAALYLGLSETSARSTKLRSLKIIKQQPSIFLTLYILIFDTPFEAMPHAFRQGFQSKLMYPMYLNLKWLHWAWYVFSDIYTSRWPTTLPFKGRCELPGVPCTKSCNGDFPYGRCFWSSTLEVVEFHHQPPSKLRYRRASHWSSSRGLWQEWGRTDVYETMGLHDFDIFQSYVAALPTVSLGL